jgi:hypothetical protein
MKGAGGASPWSTSSPRAAGLAARTRRRRSTTSTPSAISSITSRLSCACWRASSRLPRAASSSRARRPASSPASSVMTNRPMPARPGALQHQRRVATVGDARQASASSSSATAGAVPSASSRERQHAGHQHRQHQQRREVEAGARLQRQVQRTMKASRSTPMVASHCRRAAAQAPARPARRSPRQQPQDDGLHRIGHDHADQQPLGGRSAEPGCRALHRAPGHADGRARRGIGALDAQQRIARAARTPPTRRHGSGCRQARAPRRGSADAEPRRAQRFGVAAARREGAPLAAASVALAVRSGPAVIGCGAHRRQRGSSARPARRCASPQNGRPAASNTASSCGRCTPQCAQASIACGSPSRAGRRGRGGSRRPRTPHEQADDHHSTSRYFMAARAAT